MLDGIAKKPIYDCVTTYVYIRQVHAYLDINQSYHVTHMTIPPPSTLRFLLLTLHV